MVDPVSEFTPKSYACFKEGYTFTKWRTDLVAGITVGVIALPLAMAFAIASGLTPEQGLFTAIVAGFLISLLGGSRFQIGGPTGAFVVIVYAIVQKTGYAGLAISTLIAGLLLILGGLFRLGSWIKFIPYPLVTGFTTGIALIIASSQVKEFFGLDVRHVPAPFAQKWGVLLKAMPTFDPTTVCIGFGALAFILVVRRYTPKIPWGIAAIFVTTLVCQLFDLNVDTVASRFGQIPHFLPTPHWPSFAIVKTHGRDILWDAFAIAFLGGIESLLSCVIADGMTGRRHKSNCELVGQGIANIASVLFGGLPATGAIARTAANIKSGAVTPMAGMVHALTLLVIMLFLSPIVSLIPLAALAAVLFVVAWNMSELKHFTHLLLRAPIGDRGVLFVSFTLTVFVDITMAITVGMIVALFLFMRRLSEVSKLSFLDLTTTQESAATKVPEGVQVYEINGPFFFGTADMLRDLAGLNPKAFILRMRSVPVIDASGVFALKEFVQMCDRSKIELFLCDVQPDVQKDLRRLHVIGEGRIKATLGAALKELTDRIV